MNIDASVATREIMWSIPQSFKVIMYLLLFVSLGVFVKGVIEKLKFVTGGKKLRSLIGDDGLVTSFSDLNWKAFFFKQSCLLESS